MTGVNDTPILSSISGLSFTDTSGDDTFAESTAALSASDRDSGQTLSYSVNGASADTSKSGYTHSLAGDYGTIYVNSSNGNYVYVPNKSSIEALGASDTQTDQFTFNVSDGTADQSQTLTASISGANDTPILAAATGFSFTDTASDDTFSASTNALSATDADTGASLTYSITDGSADTSLSGYTHSKQGSYGTLYINASSGSYTFTPSDNAIEAASSSVNDQFTVSVSDGTSSVSQTVTASITGVNDTPTMADLAALTYIDTADDDSFASSTVTRIRAEDRDSGQTFTYGINSGSADTSLANFTHSLAGTYGRLYINASSGDYTYVPDDTAIEGLTNTQTDTFTLSSSDGTETVTKSLTATITGVNDAPVFSSISAISLTDTSADDTFSDTSATLPVTDRDNGQTLTYTLRGSSADTSRSGYTHSRATTYGSLFINSGTGAYIFVPSERAVESLSSGSVSEDFQIVVSDGDLSAGQSLIVNVSGVNDTPELSAINGISFTDTAAQDSFTQSNTGTFSGSDRDSSANLIYSLVGATSDAVRSFTHVKETSYGLLRYNEITGAYSFEPSDILINAVSASITDNIAVTVSDGVASSNQNLSINITGVDDRPIIDTSNNTLNLNIGSTGTRISVSDAEGDTISNTTANLPAWLTFRNQTVDNEVQYFWEVGENSPTWLNGTKKVALAARANGVDAASVTKSFIFTCNSDHCGDFLKSTNALSVADYSQNSNNPYSEMGKGEVAINNQQFTALNATQYDAMYNSYSGTGSFRNITTLNENSNYGNGSWSLDQRVSVNYDSRVISITSDVAANNVNILGGSNGSFTYQLDTDGSKFFSGYNGVVQSSCTTSLSCGQNFNLSNFTDKDGNVVNVIMSDHFLFSQDKDSNKSLSIYSKITPTNLNINQMESTWRHLEPQ